MSTNRYASFTASGVSIHEMGVGRNEESEKGDFPPRGTPAGASFDLSKTIDTTFL